MTELLLTTADGHARSVPLEGDLVSMGRSPENHLAFPEDGLLSRRHLVFKPATDGWAVQDLDSKNGTFVNGRRIEGERTLRAGDRISAGGLKFVFKGTGELTGEVTFEVPPGEDSVLRTKSISLPEALSVVSSRRGRVSSGTRKAWRFIDGVRELNVPRPLAELLQATLNLAMEAAEAERGVLLTFDEKDRLTAQASSGGDFRISATVRDRVLRDRVSLLVEDVAKDERLLTSDVIAQSHIRSLVAVPLQTEDRVQGMIYLDTSHPTRRFNDDDLSLLTVMANVASLRIERERWDLQRRALISEHITTLQKLAAALSHELNSPLGTIKSTIDTLVRVSAREEAGPGARESDLASLRENLHSTLEASISRIQQVIARIQRFTDLDRAEIQSIDLNELLSDTLAQLDVPEDIDVEFYFDALPPVVCRPRNLNIVFLSLLRNAVDACRQLPLKRGRILVSTHAREGRVEVRIEDNGCGIRGVDREQIFDPAFRVVEGRVAAGNWGLFSARQIIREQGGEIAIDSEEGRGTTLLVTLPGRVVERRMGPERD
ncbi:MAG TPA: ATP-binding protein [Bryobacteraceae bacterium]|nr:ATP-binding protein [Bryobacteraceae bacterium]